MRRSPRVMLAWIAAVVVMLATVRVVAGDLGALHRQAHSLGAGAGSLPRALPDRQDSAVGTRRHLGRTAAEAGRPQPRNLGRTLWTRTIG